MLAVMAEIPDDARGLFRVPPDRFVAQRDALVKQLGVDGRNADAVAVKALRKPTASVWALNQLSDREPEALAALFEAGRALRAAHQEALAGGSVDLVAAATTRREAVDRLTTATVASMREAGQQGDHQAAQIATALATASTDPAVGALLAAGTLERMPTTSSDMGFGDLPAMSAVPGGGTAEIPESGPSRAEIAHIRRERDAARKTAAKRRATADRLASQLNELSAKLEQLRTEHAEAESAALESELEAERAAKRADDLEGR